MSYIVNVQINGVKIGEVELSSNLPFLPVDYHKILAIPSIKKQIANREVVKMIASNSSKMINFVVKDNFVSPPEYAN